MVSDTTEAREEREERDITTLHAPSTLIPTTLRLNTLSLTAMKSAMVEREEKVEREVPTTVVTTEAREARDTTDVKPSVKNLSAMMSGSPTEEKEAREAAKEEREPEHTTTATDTTRDTVTTRDTDMIASMDLTTETLKQKTLLKNKIASWPLTLLTQAQVVLSTLATTDTITTEEREEKEEKDPRDAARETPVLVATGKQFANLSSPSTQHPLLHLEKEVREEKVDSTTASTTEERAARDITLLRLSTLILSTLILTAMKYATDMAEREEREVSTMEATTEEREERVPAKSAKSFAILSTHPNTPPSVTLLLTAMATTAVLLLNRASAERVERASDVVTTAEREEKEEKDTDTTVTDTPPATDTLVPTRYKYLSFLVIAKSWCNKIVPNRMLV